MIESWIIYTDASGKMRTFIACIWEDGRKTLGQSMAERDLCDALLMAGNTDVKIQTWYGEKDVVTLAYLP